MRRWVSLLLALAACSDDPSLHIEVSRPDGERYAPLIAKTVVTVYELEGLTCEQVEYGDIPSELLRGAAVAEQTIYPDRVDGALDDISRLGPKVVVARMLTEDDILIAAGCAEVGDLDGATTVAISTMVAASVSVDTVTTEDPYGKQITLVDPLGDSLVGREVRWRMFSPAGATPAAGGVIIDADDPTTWDAAAPACSDMRGIADMRLTPPSKVSGFAARFRVSWSQRPIDVISGFVRPGIGLQAITAPPPSNRCAIRTTGERRIVCAENVGTATPRAHRYEISQGLLKNYSVADRGTANITAPPAGVFAFEGEVFALHATGTVQNLFGTTALSPTPCPDCAIDDFHVVAACGDDPARIFFHSATGSPIRAIPVHGGVVQDFGSIVEAGVTANLNAVGCVTAINAQGAEKDVQVVVLDLATADGVLTRGFFRCALGRLCNVTLPFAGAGIGFVRAGTASQPEMQMLGTAFDIAGAELVAWVLRPAFDGTTYLLIDRRRIVAAAPPVQLIVAKLDADDEPDLVWNMRGTRQSLVQLSYGHPIEDGARLSALAQLPVQFAIDELAHGDLNGDGFDDLVGVTTTGFIVFPQNVDGPTVPDRTNESTCAP